MNFRKNSKGITLIALVITIIVLLILAGVSISMIMGNDGILGRAENAVNEHEKEAATETINFKITNVQIEKYAEKQRMPTLKELADKFCEDDEFQYVLETSQVAALDKIKNENPTSIFTKLKAYPYEFEINSSLQLASVNGVQIADSNSGVSNEQYDSILSRLTALETDLQTAKSELQTTKSDLQSSTERVTELENQLASNVVTKDSFEETLSGYATKDMINSSTGISRTVLYNGNDVFDTPTTQIAINKELSISDISQYKYLEFEWDVYSKMNGGYFCESTTFLAVEQIKYNNSNTAIWSDGSTFTFGGVAGINRVSVAGYFKNSTTMRIDLGLSSIDDYCKLRLRKIYGVK